MKRKSWLILGILLVLGIAGFITYRVLANRQSTTTASYQTATVTRGTLTATISSAGTVRSNQNTTIKWQTGGQVGKVNVEMGSKVKVGEVLAALDVNTISLNIIQAQTDLINTQDALNELVKPQPLKIARAEQDLQNAQTALDKLQNPTAEGTTQAELAVIDAQSAVDEAQKQVDALKYPNATAAQISSQRASLLLLQDRVNTLQNIYNDLLGTPENDIPKAQALANLDKAKSDRDHAQAVLNIYLGAPTAEEINQKNVKLAAAKAKLAQAQDTLDQLKNPSATDVALAKAVVEDAQQTLDSLKNGPTANELTIAQNRVTLAQAAVNQASLTAPFSGTITDIQIMVGDQTSSGTTAFRIDDLSKLFVDLQVSEIDVRSIQVGQPAVINFDAIPDQEYQGQVTKVGIVGSVSQGVVNYPVTVQITDSDANITPGMTAAVSIVIAEHTNVLLVPNQAVKVSANQRNVIVLFEGQQIRIPVTVGLTNDTMTEITDGQLKEGDEVLTSTTTTTTSNNQSGRFIEGGGPVFMP